MNDLEDLKANDIQIEVLVERTMYAGPLGKTQAL